MIELFARTEFPLREPNVLTPIHIDDDIASINEFYELLQQPNMANVICIGEEKI
jgi:hypothetical protein